MKKLPEGKIWCKGNGKYYKWYTFENDSMVYIPKKSRKLATDLALRKFLTLQLEDLQQQKKAVEVFLRQYPKDEGRANKMLIEMDGYREILSPYFAPISTELESWMNAEYVRNEKYPETLNHRTVSGNWVRSKSEAMIDMVLRKYNIPFRYECELQLGNLSFFPDFTIRHPRNGKLYYWEHFGLMDDPVYAKSAISKLGIYVQNGIMPMIHLITTFETADHPLSISQVEDYVKQFFVMD